MKRGVIAFDMNETVLDLTPVAAEVARVSQGRVSGGEWFARMLHRSLLANQLDEYRPFGDLGREALEWLLARVGADPAEAAGVVGTMAALPPHPEVASALESLAGAGHRMVALTNGSRAVAEAQVVHAGLDIYFEAVLSVESVGRFKPDPEVYRYAARSCLVPVAGLVLVAAHDWDIVGAQQAGAAGCFVERQPWGLSGHVPDASVSDFNGIPGALEALWTR